MADVGASTLEKIKPLLWRNERVLWSGTPSARRAVSSMWLPLSCGAVLIAFGVAELLGVRLSARIEAFREIGQIWGYIGTGTGILMLLLFAAGAVFETRNTIYLVTDKRFLLIDGFGKKTKLELKEGDASGLKLIGEEEVEIEMSRIEGLQRPSFFISNVDNPGAVAELLSDTLNLNLRKVAPAPSKKTISVGSVYRAMASTPYEMVPHQRANPFAEIFRLLFTWCVYLSVLTFVTMTLPPSVIRHCFSIGGFIIVTHGLLMRWDVIRKETSSDQK